MQAKPELRRSERFGHDCIIKFGDGLSLSPYYAVTCNLSETGMCFKSQFELYPGTNLLIAIEDYSSDRNQVPAKVVWCNKSGKNGIFRYGIGVEFLKAEKCFGFEASPQDFCAGDPGSKNGVRC